MIAGTFNEWFTLYRKTRTPDTMGGSTYVWTQYATERGRMSHLGKAASKSEESDIGAQLQEWVSHMFYCRSGVPIQRGDQVTDSSAVSYLVLAVRHPSARPARHIECECREVQQGT
jgi:hypothetical protein